nr:MAG TPA: hypothetical protein [Caudoviricetes sp.]
MVLFFRESHTKKPLSDFTLKPVNLLSYYRFFIACFSMNR